MPSRKIIPLMMKSSNIAKASPSRSFALLTDFNTVKPSEHIVTHHKPFEVRPVSLPCFHYERIYVNYVHFQHFRKKAMYAYMHGHFELIMYNFRKKVPIFDL